MTSDQAIAAFMSCSRREQEEFLAQLLYELTLVVRDSYEAGRDGLTDPQRVRRINEIQHRVSAFLWALLRNDSQRPADDALVRLILEQPDDQVLAHQLNQAFARVAARRLTAA